MIDLKKIPKVELHLHLDGSLRINTVAELLDMEEELLKLQMIAPNKCLDLNEYLTKFEIPISVMQTKDNLERVAYELGQDLIADGVIYAEVRFAPINHIRGNLSLDDVVESVLNGFKKVNIKINLILCLMRNCSFDDNYKIIQVASKYLDKGVCALDLAGAEGIYKTETFASLFKIVQNKQIPFTIHAGEADGVKSIEAAVNFGTRRIGHGIRVLEDKNMMDILKQKHIMLEICPTSNVQTNAVDNYENHPIKDLFDYGIMTTINTDNRTVSNISLTDEYYKLIKYFNFSLDDIKKMNIDAINNSFLPNIEKQNLIKKYIELFNNN